MYGSVRFKMEGLIFTVFENLDIPTLSYEECVDSLYYVDYLLDKDENAESFIKHQLIKIKIEVRLKEIRNKCTC